MRMQVFIILPCPEKYSSNHYFLLVTIFVFFQCIDTAAGYTAHLGLLLASPDTELMEICAEIPLMTRIQVMGKGDWDIDPLTLRCPTC